MKIAIVSDSHLGFGHGGERQGDAFFQFKQACEMIVREAPDVILHPGDLFDKKIPLQEIWDESLQLFGLFLNAKRSAAKIILHPRNSPSREFNFSGIPFVCIAGTHEYRSKDFKTCQQVLETANFIALLHASHAEIQVGEEKIFVHGLCGIPEKRALEALKIWNPKAIPGGKNFLVLHQSIKEFLPTADEMNVTIGLADLPAGFDYVVNGHLHWNSIQPLEQGGTYLQPGSTVATQMKNFESKQTKGFFILDTMTGKLDFREIPIQRKLFYHKIKFDQTNPESVKQRIKEVLAKDLSQSFKMKPLMRLKLVGTLAKGVSQSDVLLDELLEGFSDKAIFSVAKKFTSEDFKKKIDSLRGLQQSNASITQLGLQILEKNLLETAFGKEIDIQRLFDLLEAKELDKASELLTA